MTQTHPDQVGILAVHTSMLPLLGADTWVHARLLATLNRATHRVHVACATYRGDEPTPIYAEVRHLDQIDILPINLGPERAVMPTSSRFRLWWATLPALSSAVRLTRYVHRRHIDVLHTSDRPRDALACVLLSKITRAKSVVHLHQVHNHWMGRVLRWSIAHADARIAVSDFVRSSLDDVDPGLVNSYTVHNGIDLERWSAASPADNIATRQALGLDSEATVIITVCRLFEEKGVRLLINALSTVVQTFPEVHLLVAGVDHGPGQPYLELLRGEVHKLGLDDHVSFLGSRDDVAALMAASDIFAMPSLDEPFGLVFAEALASELPVVALDNGGTREIVVDGENGLLSDPGDEKTLTDNLVELVGDPSKRRSMGRAGRARVAEHFTLEQQANRLSDVYRLILSKTSHIT